jgi:hypothetical protein
MKLSFELILTKREREREKVKISKGNLILNKHGMSVDERSFLFLLNNDVLNSHPHSLFKFKLNI